MKPLLAKVETAVDGFVPVIHAADHGQDLAGLRPDGHQGPVGHVALFRLQLLDVAADGLLGVLLEVPVQGGVDPEPATVDQFGSEALLQPAADVKGEVGGFDVETRGGLASDLEGLGLGGRGRLGGDVALPHHRVQHDLLTALGLLGGVDGVQAGELGDGGQHGGLRQVQLPHVLAEVDLGGGLHPVGQVPVEVRVQIHFQDLILRVAAGELQGQQDLLELAGVGALVALLGIDQGVLHQLLGDGGAALDDLAAGAQVDPEGPQQAARVDPRVLVEGAILDGDGGLAQGQGDPLQGHPGAVAPGGVDHLVEEHAAGAVVDLGGLEGSGAGLDAGGVGLADQADVKGGSPGRAGRGEQSHPGEAEDPQRQRQADPSGGPLVAAGPPHPSSLQQPAEVPGSKGHRIPSSLAKCGNASARNTHQGLPGFCIPLPSHGSFYRTGERMPHPVPARAGGVPAAL
jgi:hypothetical protein